MKPPTVVSKLLPRLSLRERMGLLAAVLLLIAGVSLAFAGYRLASQAALKAIDNRAAGIATAMQREILHAVRPVQPYLSALARSPLPGIDRRKNA